MLSDLLSPLGLVCTWLLLLKDMSVVLGLFFVSMAGKDGCEISRLTGGQEHLSFPESSRGIVIYDNKGFCAKYGRRYLMQNVS